MTYDLWPPADYPDLTAPTPTVTGCTRNSTVSGLSTFTAQTPAVDAATTRLIRPIFVKGQGGVLRWSVTVAISGNLLTADQASIETSTTGWQTRAEGEGAPTIARSTAQFAVGAASMSLTATGSNVWQRAEIPSASRIAASAGQVFTAAASIRDSKSGRTGNLVLAFYNGGGSLIAYPDDNESSMTAGTWYPLSVTGTAPANTASVGLILGTNGTTSTSDVAWVDKIGLWHGTGGDWAMPGSSISGVSGGPTLTATAQVIFLDDSDAQVGRWVGPERAVGDGVVLSARVAVPRQATQVRLRVLTLGSTGGMKWTEYDSRLEQIPADDPYTPPVADPEFAVVSAEGVAAPPPPAGLSGFEANSPARRSPQVRWCQVHDSIRPDLTPKKNAREV